MNFRIQLARLKRRLLKKPILRDPKYPPYWLEKTLKNKEAFILQIGSNDGKTGDPLNQLLNKYQKWKALFVEPVPYLFERLKDNYPDKNRFVFENAAINEGDRLNFYWVDPEAKDELFDLPYWYDQLGSFNEQHIINELGDKMKPFILSQELEGITLKALLERNNIKLIDLLHIDTEGHDWKILSQLDLETYAPKFILYEANHLSEDNLKDSYDFLSEKYFLFDVGIDVFAVNKNLHKEDIIKMKKCLILINHFSKSSI